MSPPPVQPVTSPDGLPKRVLLGHGASGRIAAKWTPPPQDEAHQHQRSTSQLSTNHHRSTLATTTRGRTTEGPDLQQGPFVCFSAQIARLSARSFVMSGG